MPNPTYLIHALIVFAVPALFGWVILRRIAREHDWLVLIPGSVLLGVLGLMTLMNELRYWLGMHEAVWFAYKFMLLVALLLCVLTRRPRGMPRLAGGSGRIAWAFAALLGAAVAGVFFGLPAFRGLLHDAWWFHYPTATQIVDVDRFPLTATFALDDPLYYHFGPDILAAVWSVLLDTSVQNGFAITISLCAPAIFLLTYTLILRATRSHFGGLAAAGLLLVGGNFLFLRLFTSGESGPLGILHSLNSQTIDGLLKLMFTPSHGLGIPAVLLGLVVFRHFYLRPSWPLAALLGLTLGSMTLIAEWYALPFAAATGLCLAWREFGRWRSRRARLRSALMLAPFLTAAACGLFNNTYVAGIFGHLWMGNRPANIAMHTRVEVQKAAVRTTVPPALASSSLGASGAAALAQELQDPADTLVPLPKLIWSAPPLLPLRLNLANFGMVPSWNAAESNESGSIPIFSVRFAAECGAPLLLGLPFALWLLARRSQNLLLRVLVLLAVISIIPPVFLEWGYRSSDFLRFFTGAFCFGAVLLGWLIGRLWESSRPGLRLGAGMIVFCGLINPAIIGYLGLQPSTFAAVRNIGETAGSLSDAANDRKAVPSGTAASTSANSSSTPAPESIRQEPGSGAAAGGNSRSAALTKLSTQAGLYLYPITRGRERALVIVPASVLPPLNTFPEWLKFATLARVQLPIGWYWNDSLYAAYQREAVRSLSPTSLAALDIKWVIVSNVFGPPPPAEAQQRLADRTRFPRVATFRADGYSLSIYKVMR